MDRESTAHEGTSPAILLAEPSLAADAASLRYVHTDEPGIQRIARGRSFTYRDASGRPVRDRATLDRIAALVIPPAWTAVWICADARGHIQAFGRDARGRKQYRYHARWRAVRDEAKYDYILTLAAVLPKLRRRIEADLSRPGLDAPKVIATILRLMEQTCVRIGNDCYAKENRTYGLTTLCDRHAHVRGDRLELIFVGKSGKRHHVALTDRRLARLVKQCRDVPGQRLFQWVDAEGHGHPVTSTDVNAYLREATGIDVTAKMLRTFHATAIATRELRALGACASQRAGKRAIVRCLERVAAALGNTPAICRKSYVHPRILEGYLAQTFEQRMASAMTQAKRSRASGLSVEERAMIALLRGDEEAGSRRIAA